MAYKGKRDPEMDIVIRQELCNKYKSKDGLTWVEMFIPRSDGSAYEWGTIMVKPDQVYFIDDVYNLVRVNSGADIINSTKEKNTRVILDSEHMTPDIIIGHVLRKELDMPYMTASQVYDDYKKSGLTMYNYIILHKQTASDAQ